jgi:GTP-binding protein
VDKVSATALGETQKDIERQLKAHPAAFPQISLTSSEKKSGIAELRAEVAQFAIGSPQ